MTDSLPCLPVSEVVAVFNLGKVTGHSQTDGNVGLPLALPADDGGGPLDPVAGVAGDGQTDLTPIARTDLGLVDLRPGTLADHTLGPAGFPDSALAAVAGLGPARGQLVARGALHLDGVPLLVVVPGALHHRRPHPWLQLSAAANRGTPLTP